MNWHNELKEIYAKLHRGGYENLANEIHDAQLSGGTGGEIYDAVISRLIAIKNNNPDVYRIIQHEIDALIDFGISIGYLRR